MSIVALFALEYGTPHWSFPWWVWVLAILLEVGGFFREEAQR